MTVNEPTCAHCGGIIDPEAQVHDGQGHDGDTWWCSDICRQIVVEHKWPSPVGPATHEEMQGWIYAQRSRISESFVEMQERIARREAELGRPLSEEALIDMATSAAKGHYARGGN